MASLGQAGHEGQRGEARNGSNGADDSDPGRIDADGFQPYREERQMSTKDGE